MTDAKIWSLIESPGYQVRHQRLLVVILHLGSARRQPDAAFSARASPADLVAHIRARL